MLFILSYFIYKLIIIYYVFLICIIYIKSEMSWTQEFQENNLTVIDIFYDMKIYNPCKLGKRLNYIAICIYMYTYRKHVIILLKIYIYLYIYIILL